MQFSAYLVSVDRRKFLNVHYCIYSEIKYTDLDNQSLTGLHANAYLSLIYEGAIGQPKETTSLCDTLLFTVNGTITQLCILKNQPNCTPVTILDYKIRVRLLTCLSTVYFVC
jgi:hypothetical protein